MTRRDVEASPQTYARTGGLIYLLIIVIALFAEAYVRGSLIVSGGATPTARKNLGSGDRRQDPGLGDAVPRRPGGRDAHVRGRPRDGDDLVRAAQAGEQEPGSAR